MNARPESAPIPSAPGELLSRPDLRLRVGEHVVDVGALRLLTRPAHPRLTGKAVAVLIELARHSGNTVTRDQLLDRVWPGRVITPDVLTQAIKELRRAFADDEKPSRYIETIPKVGYRLLAAVTEFGADEAPVVAATLEAANADGEALRGTDGRRASTEVLWRWHARPALLAVAGICVAMLAGLAFLAMRPHASGRRETSWTVTDLRAITSDPGAELRPRISPDGTRLAYVKVDPGTRYDRVHVRAIEPSAVSYLAPPADAAEELPTWSPDGTRIAFERLDYTSCKMFVASSAGGALREIGACRDVRTNIFDWTPDGSHLITAAAEEGTGADAPVELSLEKLDVASGARERIGYDRGVNDQDLDARYSPDGAWIAFRRGIAPYSNLCVMRAGGGAVRQLTDISTRIHGYTWTRDSSALVFSANLRGTSELFVVGLGDGDVRPLGVKPAEYPDAARIDDTIVYEIPKSTTRLAQLTVGGDGNAALLAESTGSDGAPALSPDGSLIAFVSDRSGSQQLWLYRSASDTAFPLTDFRDSVLLSPSWSADGSAVVLVERHAGRAHLVEVDVATQRQRIIGTSQEHVLWGGYGPEPGSYLLLAGRSGPSDKLLYLRHYGAASQSERILASGVEHAEVDGDSDQVYYTRTAQHGLFRRDLDGDGPEQFVTPQVNSTHLDGWRVVGGKIWYVNAFEFNPTPIRQYDPRSGDDRVIGEFKVALSDVNFSVDAAHRRIVIVPVGAEDTDVGAFQLRATAAAK